MKFALQLPPLKNKIKLKLNFNKSALTFMKRLNIYALKHLFLCWLFLKRGFGGCGGLGGLDRFGGFDGLGGFSGFSGLGRFGRFVF